jgi:Uma2 family endonuclease
VALSPTEHRFTVKDYHRMAKADVFGPDDRVELFDGRVYEMSPIGSWHAACVRRLNALFAAGVGDRAIVSVQSPIWLDEYSEPEPDVALLRIKADFYKGGHPGPDDVLLVVEVAESSLAYDLKRKALRYVATGIPEVWVIDVVREFVHVVTGGGSRTAGREDSLAPAAFPDIVLAVADVLGVVS